MLVPVYITSFCQKMVKIEFFTRKMTKNGQNGYFVSKLPEKLLLLPENNICTQIPSVELAEATFCEFPENIF